ncbi:Uncharacterised protein [uncultured archaeon]|nr:Uncharacterised protein [uncultured archaeon]
MTPHKSDSAKKTKKQKASKKTEPNPPRPTKFPDTLAAIFTVLTATLLYAASQPGVAVTDEVAYLLATDAYVKTGSYSIHTLNPKLPQAPFLFLYSLTPAYGRIYPQYPPGYTIIAAPFYAAMGIKGFILISVLSYAATLLIIYKLSVHVLKDKNLGLISMAAYGLFSYIVPYAVAVWPHSLTVALSTLAAYIAVTKNSKAPLLTAGLLFGAAVTVRYGVLLPAALSTVYILLAKRRLLPAFILGALPFALFLLHNQITVFGALTTGYKNFGGEFGGAAYVVLPALIYAAAILLLFKNKNSHQRKNIFAAIFMVLVAAAALYSPARNGIVKSAQVLYAETIDIQTYPDDPPPTFKKALLQSAPYIAALPAAIILLTRKRALNAQTTYLIALGLMPVVFYSLRVNSHGGATFTMRYFLEGLPYLVAFSVIPLIDALRTFRIPPAILLSSATAVFIISAATAPLLFVNSTGELNASYIHTYPLLLAALTFTSTLIFVLRQNRTTATLLTLIFLTSFAYSFTADQTDLQTDLKNRADQNAATKEICGLIPNGSLLLINTQIDALEAAPAKTCTQTDIIKYTTKEEVTQILDEYLNNGRPAYVYAMLTSDKKTRPINATWENTVHTLRCGNGHTFSGEKVVLEEITGGQCDLAMERNTT